MKTFLVFTVALGLTIPAFAQPKYIAKAEGPKLYLNGFGGYTFDESFNVGSFAGKLDAAAHYGGSLEYVLQGISTPYHERTIEISYQSQSTTLDGWSYSAIPPAGYRPVVYDVTTNYFTLGINNYFGRSRKVMGFGGLHIGAGWLNNKDNGASETKFAGNIKGGGRFMLTDKIGLKVYAQLNTIIGGVGGGFYFGTGGASAGVSTYSSITQFGLGGGLTIGLGGTSKPAAPANP